MSAARVVNRVVRPLASVTVHARTQSAMSEAFRAMLNAPVLSPLIKQYGDAKQQATRQQIEAHFLGGAQKKDYQEIMLGGKHYTQYYQVYSTR